MKIDIFPQPTDRDDMPWAKTYDVPCLPPIGAHIAIDDSLRKPLVGHVTHHSFNLTRGQVEVKVELITYSEMEIKKYCSSTQRWERRW